MLITRKMAATNLDTLNMETLGFNMLSDQQQETVEMREAYPWSCDCGESFLEASHAWSCKKCRIYLSEQDQLARVVTNTQTGVVQSKRVWRGWFGQR